MQDVLALGLPHFVRGPEGLEADNAFDELEGVGPHERELELWVKLVGLFQLLLALCQELQRASLSSVQRRLIVVIVVVLFIAYVALGSLLPLDGGPTHVGHDAEDEGDDEYDHNHRRQNHNDQKGHIDVRRTGATVAVVSLVSV